MIATCPATAGGRNTLYERLVDPAGAQVLWPAAAAEGQARFLAGLRALHEAGALDPFEPAKQGYIGSLGAAPVRLVQGPPGTGKSYVTAFALLARLQGAVAANMDCRACAACKTHAATDVLMTNILKVQRLLRQHRACHPALFVRYFDARLLDVPLFRARPRAAPPEGVSALQGPDDRAPNEPRNVDRCMAARWCVVAATPGGIYGLLKERWPGNLFGHDLCACLVLDEASQMNLPEAVMAALPLKEDGQLIVVGDPRQMPPIAQHDWGAEPRRSVREYRSYESLFLGVLRLKPPIVKFAESFRLHADMAEFLRAEIYVKDGIDYHSRRRETLPPYRHADPFVAGVLAPGHPIVVVVHDRRRGARRGPILGGVVPTFPRHPMLTVSIVTTADRADAYNCPSRHQGNKCGACRACWNRGVKAVAYHKH